MEREAKHWSKQWDAKNDETQDTLQELWVAAGGVSNLPIVCGGCWQMERFTRYTQLGPGGRCGETF